MRAPDRVPSLHILLSLLLFVFALTTDAAANDRDRRANEDRLDWYERTGVFHVSASEVRTVQALEKKLSKRPDSAVLLEQLGKRWLAIARKTREHEDASAAESIYRKFTDQQPGSSDAWIGLGRALHERHHFRASLEAARRAAEIQPKDASVFMLLSDVHFALGNYVESELVVAKLSETPSLHSLARESQLLAVRGRTGEASALLRRAIARGKGEGVSDRTLAQVQFLLGELAREQEQFDVARTELNGALQLDPESDAARLSLARLDLATGRISVAISALTELCHTSPHPTHWMTMARAFKTTGNQVAAQSWWSKVQIDFEADLAGGDVGHLREYAILLLERGRPDEAIAYAKRDLAEVRRDVAAFETLAWVLHQAGRSREAIEPMRAALRTGSIRPQLLARAAAIKRGRGTSRLYGSRTP